MNTGAALGMVALLAVGWQDAGLAKDTVSDEAAACPTCGVIRTIRERQGERPIRNADTALDQRNSLSIESGAGKPLLVGPVAGFSFGPGRKLVPFVGARGGDRMLDHMRETSFDIIVWLDVGGYTTVTEPDASDLQVGDRVRIVDGRLQLAQ